MQSLWNDDEAAKYVTALQQRVYSSRLLGNDPSLVMHGGGNTSVKIRQPNLYGEEEEVLYVKGSGWDLATIEEAGFAPVRMEALLRLATLDSLSDAEMKNQLRCSMTQASAPSPSVEAILHGILPYKFVDHTHADALISVCNTPGGEQKIKDIFGDTVVIIPYVMPGFKLARYCAEVFPKAAHQDTIGMVLMQHGLFTFGESAKEAYMGMIQMVNQLENYLNQHNALHLSMEAMPDISSPKRDEIASLRRDISEVAGQAMILITDTRPASCYFANHPEVVRISQQGPATPDHVIRTKAVPLLGRDVASFKADYEAYFERNQARVRQPLTMLDPAPRVVLDSTLGVLAIGNSVKGANIARDIYQHTIEIILRAEQLGGFRALPDEDLFDIEYWELEQAKLKRAGKPPLLTGEIALVTGAASGIGKASVEALLKRGAAVIGLDINPAITELFSNPAFLGLTCDLRDEAALQAALERGVRAFGGIDIAVLNAGIFPPSQQIKEMKIENWRQSMSINLDANLILMRELHPLLKLAPRQGKVVIIGSKNVPAPGPGAAAYSASKAALNQLARVAALEWGKDGIRVNTVHPNAVFDTAIWTEEILTARAASYGLSVAEYKTRNVMQVEVTSHDVAEVVAQLCGPSYAKTTGAQIPIDGGNLRVI